MSNAETKNNFETKTSASPETSGASIISQAPEVFCDSRCTICQSDYIKIIHDLKKAGNSNRDVIKILFDKYKFKTSESSMSRHFSRYEKQKSIISANLINDDLVEDATKQAVHTKKIVELIDLAFTAIQNQINMGYRFDISDLEKLMKLRYQVMSGQDTDENDILAIFQKASNKYGLNLSQGVLFKSSSPNSPEAA